MSSEAVPAMPPGSVQVNSLGKAYRLYQHKWGRAAEWLGLGSHHHQHWVLRDVHLSIAPGEAVGIIGENGAGKSTLLKLITGVSHPTSGSIDVAGHVAALLELGIGFHPEFSGRDNAMNTLRLSGVADADLPRYLPEVEAFADIGDYFHYPVRTYSSGMQVRLAFAVATAVRPDVLIVDEALAVGDVFFQQKCFDRIRIFREQGTTLLFVSHAMSTVYALCDRAVLLQHGRIVMDAEPRAVIDLYNAHVASQTSVEPVAVVAAAEEGAPVGSYHTDDASLAAVTILQDGNPVSTVLVNEDIIVRIEADFRVPIADPHIGFQVRDNRGEALYMAHTHGLGLSIGRVAAGERVVVEFRFLAALYPGDYTVTAGIARGGKPEGQLEQSLVRHQDAIQFSVTSPAAGPYWGGRFNLGPRCTVRRPASLPGSAPSDPAPAPHQAD